MHVSLATRGALLVAAGCVPDDWTYPVPPDVPADVATDGRPLDATADLAADLPSADDACGSGPVARYRAEGDARDEVGLHHAALRNGVTFVKGRFGRAFHIGGAPQYVEVPSEVADFDEGDFTIALWFRTTGDGVMLARRAQCAGSPLMLGEDFGVSSLGHVAVEMFTVGGYFVLRTRPGQNDGAWHFTAIVRRGDRVHLTLDGRIEDTREIAGTFSDPTHTPTFLGFSRCVTGAPGSNGIHDLRTWYVGDLDELAFYRRALTDAELLATAQGRCPP